MKNTIRILVTVLLCILIALSSLSAIFSNFMRSSILSQDFFLGIVATPSYLSMVKDAIKTEFKAQSSYVGIPEEVLNSTLDDASLHLMLRSHIASATAYLNGLAPFDKPVYPEELLTAPLLAWLDQTAEAQGMSPTQEQKDQMTVVARDSGAIIQKQICLIDLDLVRERGAFQNLLQVMLRIRDGFVPSVLLMFASCVLLIILHIKNWRVWLHGILISFWMTGTLVMVPSLVLRFSGLTRRLAISTPYLKYAVDAILSDMNLYFLLWGILLFSITSVSLCILTWTYHPVRKEKHHTMRQISVQNL